MLEMLCREREPRIKLSPEQQGQFAEPLTITASAALAFCAADLRVAVAAATFAGVIGSG